MLPYLFGDAFPLTDPVLIFSIVLLLFLFAPIVMKKFNLPGMIGLLFSGAILGPNALGLLARDSSFVLLGAVGLTYIMFTAALEIDLSAFKKYRFQSIVFGFVTFLVPQGIGCLISYYVLGFDWPAAILLASMFGSHTLLAYPIASRLGLSKNRAVTTVLGGSMISDTLALLVLAVIAATTAGELTDSLWWRLGVSISIFVAVVMMGLPKIGRWFFAKFPDDASAQFVFILSSVFLCASLSRLASLEPIVGAFLSGLALNRLVPHNSILMNRLSFTGNALFIPFFLLSVGMLIDFTVIFGSFRTWFIAIGMILSVIATKWLAAHIIRIVFRYKKEEGQLIFGLSVVQAAATLAAVMVGHRIGLFDDAVVNGTIMMILVTCILGPYVVNKYGAPLAKDEEESLGENTESAKILIPLISMDQVKPTVELALALRNAKTKETLCPTMVIKDVPEVEEKKAKAEKILNAAVVEINSGGAPCEKIIRVEDSTSRALLKIRKEVGAKTILLPWDFGYSFFGKKLGSVIDVLVDDHSVNLIVSHLVTSLSVCSRIVILFPTGVELDDALKNNLIVIEKLAKELGCSLMIITAAEEAKFIKNEFDSIDNTLSIKWTSYSEDRQWFWQFSDQLNEQDLVIIHGPSFYSAIEKAQDSEFSSLHKKIINKFPKNNILILFGSQINTKV